MIKCNDLVARLNTFFNVSAFDESSDRGFFPTGYESIFQRFATPDFLSGPWNGLVLDNAETVERVYMLVFPAQDVLDKILAREVQRGAPGAMIFSHHLADYQESGPGFNYMSEAQMEEFKEHHISYYLCHAPLDSHPKISTPLALANALKLREVERFAPGTEKHPDRLSGVHGKAGPVGFNEFAAKVAEATGLPSLRYDSIRHNGRPVQHVAVVTGAGGNPEAIRAAINLECDTYVTGEWWLYGPGDWRTPHRDAMRTLLADANINLIGTSHYASEAVVMRDQMPLWFYDNVPEVEPVFIAQDNPWR